MRKSAAGLNCDRTFYPDLILTPQSV